MLLIIGFDALDKKMVEKFNCDNLKQTSYGITDVSDFKLTRTIALWSSFLAGKNLENEIPVHPQEQWKFSLSKENTFLKYFSKVKAIDVPGFNYYQDEHALQRKLMSGYFEEKNTVEDYDSSIWDHHEKVKNEFFGSLEENWDLLFGYFSITDTIGHLSFGDEEKMKKVYHEADSIVSEVKRKFEGKDVKILIISDHGMRAQGRFGEHTNFGFWSLNREMNLHSLRIWEFSNIIRKL